MEIGPVGAHFTKMDRRQYRQSYLLKITKTASQDRPIAYTSDRLAKISNGAMNIKNNRFPTDLFPFSKTKIRNMSGKMLTYKSATSQNNLLEEMLCQQDEARAGTNCAKL